MPSIRIFFHKGAEGFIRGLVIGTAIIDTGSKYASDFKRFNIKLYPPKISFRSNVHFLVEFFEFTRGRE